MFRMAVVISAIVVVSAAVIEQMSRIELERKNFTKFQVNETVDNSGKHLRIVGCAFSSVALNLNHVSLVEKGNVLYMHVFTDGQPFYLLRTINGPDRPLNFSIDLHPRIERVVLGRNQVQIWPTKMPH